MLDKDSQQYTSSIRSVFCFGRLNKMMAA